MSHERLSLSLPSLSYTGSNCFVNFRPAVSPVAGLHTKPPNHFNVPYILHFHFHSKTMISTTCALLVLSCLYSVLTFCSSLILFRWAESSRLFSHMLPLTSLIWLTDPASHCIKHTEQGQHTEWLTTGFRLSLIQQLKRWQGVSLLIFFFLVLELTRLTCCNLTFGYFGPIERETVTA